MKTCRKCGHRLTTKNVSPGYRYYCPNCDEDMYGIEAREYPVVVVKNLGDGRVATRKSHFAVKLEKRKWAVSAKFYNPVTGRFDYLLVERSTYRTRKAAEKAAEWYDRNTALWNWWCISPDYVREKARESGVIVRIFRERRQDVSK